jgi:hypothetical protein
MIFSDIIKNISSEERPYYGDLHDSFLFECGVKSFNNIKLETIGFTEHIINTPDESYFNAIYFNGTFICLSYQSNEDSDMEFYWVDRETYTTISEFVTSFEKTEKPDPLFIGKDLYIEDGIMKIVYGGILRSPFVIK